MQAKAGLGYEAGKCLAGDFIFKPPTATAYFTHPGRLPHVEALVAAREGGVDCQPRERPKTLRLPRGREHQREKLEGAGVPAAKPGEPFDDLGGGLTALGTLEDTVEARARLL